ncbi:nuclear transport factor 2 family protein [Nevskia soli]|uniref:nuclear transport factor 2 family protein n=1 Tax=Nevskia soli TaxID=418856 RepID=UPI00068942A5|nr:nuclear transport factor 2 family protein [Nevskia soli]
MVKNLLLSFALAASLAAAPAGWAAASSGDAVPGPVSVVDAFHAALKANDPATALKMLSVSVSIFEQGFVDQTRADYAGAHIAADAAFASNDLQILERRIIWLGDNAACVISKTHTQGNFQGHPIDLVGTETMVLQRSGNSWTIEHIHWSAHPGEGEAKPAADKH